MDGKIAVNAEPLTACFNFSWKWLFTLYDADHKRMNLSTGDRSASATAGQTVVMRRVELVSNCRGV